MSLFVLWQVRAEGLPGWTAAFCNSLAADFRGHLYPYDVGRLRGYPTRQGTWSTQCTFDPASAATKHILLLQESGMNASVLPMSASISHSHRRPWICGGLVALLC